MSTDLLNLVKMSNAGKRVPVTSLIRENPQLAAVVSKLIQGQNRAEHTSKGDRKITAPDEHALNQISVSIARNVRENKSLMQMLPDMELGFQILISVVCAPKDMVTLELIFETALDLNPSLVAKLTQEIRDYFNNVYKIKSKIPEIFRNLFQITGSHIEVVLPENSIDEVINRNGSISLEEYNNIISTKEFLSEKGILGPGLESNATIRKEREQRTLKTGSLRTITGALENHSFYDIDSKQVVSTTGRPLALVGKDSKVEIFEDVRITDNPNVLRSSALLKSLRKGAIETKLGLNVINPAIENFRVSSGSIELTDRVLTDLIYKPRKNTYKQMEIVKTQNQLQRSSIGEPLIMHLPSEAVVPVITPGNEKHHVGYFVLLDETGNPVRGDLARDGYGMLAQRLSPSVSQNSSMLNRLNNLNSGIQCSNYLEAQRSVRIHTDLVEQDIMACLKNGMFANGVMLARVEDMYRILLSRKLENQRSTILFLPVETVTYFALKYNEHGVGVSLLDEMKIINSQRAVLMFANTMAGVLNSINRTQVEIKLDEEDPDPQNTVEMFMDSLVRTNTNMFPLGVDSPSDIVTYLQRAHFEFKYSGHPGMPDMSVEFTNRPADHNKVDTELEEQLRKYAYAGIGLSVEYVDNGFNGQTATSVVAENLMLSRRALTIQEQFNPHLSDHCRKVIRASQPLADRLRNIIAGDLGSLDIDINDIQTKVGPTVDAKSAVVERVLFDFVSSLTVSLPQPNMATIKAQKEAMEMYEDFVESGINWYISSDNFSSDIMGSVADSVESFKKLMKAYFMRKYMADNGVLTELSDLVNVDENGKPYTKIFAEVEQHIKKLMATTGNMLKNINDKKKQSDALLEKLVQTSDSGGSSYDDNAGSDDTGGSSDPFGDDMGLGGDDDPFGMDDLGGEDKTKPEEKPAENPEEEPKPE